MLKQLHYHIYMFIVSLLLVASGGLMVFAWLSDWSVLALVGCVVLVFCALCLMWRGASFLPEQVKYFLGCLLSKETMSRYPDTYDTELQQMYVNMNRIMQTYGQTQIELETKRMYYDRILRIMTHELRNSITPIISLSEDMLKRQYAPEDSREAIEVINEQCIGIKHFLDSYYELTHLPKPELKEVDARTLLQSIEKLYMGQGVSINCTQGLRLLCDQNLILQVLKNLVKNALEAPSTQVEILASCPEGHPRICVSDNGPGIPTNKQEEIFLPFYTSKPTGSGIGLALSRQIMTLHKGSLTCSSNENDGATFILQF